MRSRKVSLVTGGAGFMGSHLTDELIEMNHKVVVLDDLSGGFIQNINKRAIFVKGSINNEKLVKKLFEHCRFDYIYHLAAYAAEGLSPFIRKFNYENNLIGSINLINLAIKYEIKRFIFTSSIAVYGTNQVPMTEKMMPQPEDPYGISKYAVELDLKAANKLFGLTYTIFRPHNVYGERQNYIDPFRNVIGIFINCLFKNRPLPIFGDGKQKRAFSYIGDVAPYIARSSLVEAAKNEVFNIGADRPITIFELAHLVAKIMNIKPKFKFLPSRYEVEVAYGSHEKIRKVFKIKKSTGLREGIEKMVEWAKKNKLSATRFKKIEIYKNMPRYWRDLL